jgi:hypothetical protein
MADLTITSQIARRIMQNPKRKIADIRAEVVEINEKKKLES